ncbi:MAG: YbbR-like domain-containing protein [Blastocatellia bacterium]
MIRGLTPKRQLQLLFHLLLENRWLKLLSLILAILLFYFSRQPGSSIRISGVPIEFIGVPAGMEIVNIDSPVVNLQLRGPRNLLVGLSGNEIMVPVDLSKKEQGERVAHIQIRDVRLPDRIEVINISPASLRLRLERTLSHWAGVRPRTEGSLPNGLEIYDISVSPDRIRIEGPEHEVLRYPVLSTETINLNGREAAFSLLVDVEVPLPLRVIGSEQVCMTIVPGETRVRRVISGVALQLPGRADARGPVRPRRIAVELWGPRSLVNELKASDIGAVIPGGEQTAAGSTPPAPQITLPERYREAVVARPVSAPRPRDL